MRILEYAFVYTDWQIDSFLRIGQKHWGHLITCLRTTLTHIFGFCNFLKIYMMQLGIYFRMLKTCLNT